jgi:cbb3-type cytochrome oxidase subunit 3
MNHGLWGAIGTVTAFIGFIGCCWWAYSSHNRERFEENGRIVLETDPLYKKKHEQDSAEKSQ